KSTRIIKEIKERGFKITPQRQLVAEALEGNKTHPTVEDLYREVAKVAPTISIATIYKTLNELVEIGTIQRLDVGDGKAHFDPNITPHNHFVCLRCGGIYDIPTKEEVKETSELSDFKVLRAQTVYYGYCKKCKDKV
ncbi:MAG: Fur family transcriptional regulator, partial [bacterium]